MIAVGMEAADDRCAGRVADVQAGGSGAQGRALLAQGDSAGGLRGGADLLDLPAAHPGAVELERMAAIHLGGRETKGRRRPHSQEFVEQSADLGGPSRMMIAAGCSRCPRALPAAENRPWQNRAMTVLPERR